MNELIKIETKDGIETVNARELHGFLEVQTRFNDWIKDRIEKYEFKENIDFVCLTEKTVTQRSDGQAGAATQTNYFLSLDMAKELSMVENNLKGREARRYFIEVEKKAKLILPVIENQLKAMVGRIEALERKPVKVLPDPKAKRSPMKDFHDGEKRIITACKLSPDGRINAAEVLGVDKAVITRAVRGMPLNYPRVGLQDALDINYYIWSR